MDEDNALLQKADVVAMKSLYVLPGTTLGLPCRVTLTLETWHWKVEVADNMGPEHSMGSVVPDSQAGFDMILRISCTAESMLSMLMCADASEKQVGHAIFSINAYHTVDNLVYRV